MEHATSAQIGTQIAPKPMPELGRLKQAAERIAKARSDIECFLDRFNGEGSGCAGGGVDERPGGYRNDLTAVFTQIERLEAAVSALDSIG